MIIEVIKKEMVNTNVWSGGLTNEYVIYPKACLYVDKNFMFRISSATITLEPSIFTRFNGYHRYLVMLEGDLNAVKNNKIVHYDKNTLFQFDSNDIITSYSRGKDFNLMLHHTITNEVVLVSKESFSTQKRFVCLFALTDVQITINERDYDLSEHDCLMVENKDFRDLSVQLRDDVIIAYW